MITLRRWGRIKMIVMEQNMLFWIRWSGEASLWRWIWINLRMKGRKTSCWPWGQETDRQTGVKVLNLAWAGVLWGHWGRVERAKGKEGDEVWEVAGGQVMEDLMAVGRTWLLFWIKWQAIKGFWAKGWHDLMCFKWMLGGKYSSLEQRLRQGDQLKWLQ